jgi:hypothetical protein
LRETCGRAASNHVDAALPPVLRLRWSGGRVQDKTRRQRVRPIRATPRPGQQEIRFRPLSDQNRSRRNLSWNTRRMRGKRTDDTLARRPRGDPRGTRASVRSARARRRSEEARERALLPCRAERGRPAPSPPPSLTPGAGARGHSDHSTSQLPRGTSLESTSYGVRSRARRSSFIARPVGLASRRSAGGLRRAG